jgi:hypothetical protein
LLALATGNFFGNGGGIPATAVTSRNSPGCVRGCGKPRSRTSTPDDPAADWDRAIMLADRFRDGGEQLHAAVVRGRAGRRRELERTCI